MSNELILVVDDGDSNRKLYNRLLSRVGYKVDSAINAHDALIKLQTERPQLILVDIHLGGMNGLELTHLLKTNVATSSIAVIVMTAHSDEYNEREAREAGADAFVTLPIDITTFVPLIRRVLKTDHHSPIFEQKSVVSSDSHCLSD